MTLALLSWLREPVELQWSMKVPDAWHSFDFGLRPWPKTLTARGAKASRLAKAVHAARVGSDVVVRRSLVEKLLPAEGVVLRDVTVLEGRKVVSREFALLDVTAHAPLDRSASEVTWSNGWLSRLQVAAWKPERTPRAPLFRIGEALTELVATTELADALTAALGVFGRREVSPAELAQRAIHTHHPSAQQPIDPAPKSEEAYWALVRGEGRAKERALACKSPLWAWWLARTVDGVRKNDTALGVLKHPTFAALYAGAFGGAPAFEQCCAGDWWSARYYAVCVAKKVTKALAAPLREAEENLDAVAKLAAWAKR